MRIAQTGKTLATSFNNVTAKASVLMALGLSTLAVNTGTASAYQCSDPKAVDFNSIQCGADAAKPAGAATDLPTMFSLIANVLIYIVGAVAVIMLIIGGLRYVISQGDSKNVEAAKNTILYAVIGIIVAILSFAIVNFVIGKF